MHRAPESCVHVHEDEASSGSSQQGPAAPGSPGTFLKTQVLRPRSLNQKLGGWRLLCLNTPSWGSGAGSGLSTLALSITPENASFGAGGL